ncbi:MAG TPA: IgGFc-binding protein, partial [Polyangiaceae bacterium]
MRVSGRSGVLRTLRHLSALSFIASVGCGSARAPSNEQGGTSGSSSAGTGGARAETGGTANGGQPELVVPDENAGSANATRCTSDLRSVVNDSGVAVKECPPDQGCANGVCLAACDAAAKSRGSVGCEFFALDPPSEWNGQPGQVPPEDAFCYAVFLANGWNRSAKLTVSRAGQNLDVRAFARIPRGSGAQVQYEALPETGLPANEVAVLFLSRKLSLAATEQPGPYCPVAPAIEEDAAIWSTGRGLAFHITSDTPLSAYDIAPYRDLDAGAASATLLLPAPTWGTNYIAVAPNPVLDLESAVNPIPGRLWTTIVAMEDETTVRVSPSVPFPSAPSGTLPSVAPAAVGAVTEYKLQAGEAIQWQQAVADGMQQSPDPSGSVFESEKPFGLWTGNTRLTVPSATGPFQNRVDAEHEQLPPVHALGS